MNGWILYTLGENHKQRWEVEYIYSMFKAESKVNQEKGGGSVRV